MSAAGKLRALDESDNADSMVVVLEALPYIVAVVEGAEKPRMEEVMAGGMRPFCRLCERPVHRHHKNCALAALDSALGDD